MTKKLKKTCPWCGNATKKTLKSSPAGRVTRCCERRIVTVAGAWYQTHEDAPVWLVIERVAMGIDVTVAFADITYQKWTRGAKTLLARCGGALDLALRVLETFFTDKRWEWYAGKCKGIYFILGNNVFAKLMSDTRRRDKHTSEQEKIQERRTSDSRSASMETVYAAAGGI